MDQMKIVVLTTEELEKLVKKSILEALGGFIESEILSIDIFLTIEQCCSFLEVSEEHLNKLTSQNEIPHYKSHEKVRYLVSDLNEWIKEGKVETIKN
jgi:excisionase family DNA binding protein